jgi:hypothetical protein
MEGKTVQKPSDKNAELPVQENAEREEQTGDVAIPHQGHPEEELLFPFPTELNLCILRFFSSKELLQKLALVNRKSYRLSNIVVVERYERLLAHSQLWRCLPAIASDTPGEGESSFLHYITQVLAAPGALPPNWAANNCRLAAFVEAWVNQFNTPIMNLSQGVDSAAAIQAKAQTLLINLGGDTKPQAFLEYTEFKDLLRLIDNHAAKVKVCQQYDELDQIFSTLLLFIAFSFCPAEHRLAIMLNSHFSRGLRGEGLLALDTSTLIEGLLTIALNIHIMPVKSDAQNEQLIGIENILARLSEANLLTHLASDRFRERCRVFIEAIRANYTFVLKKLSEAVLLKLEGPKDWPRPLNQFFVIPHILRNPVLLGQMSKSGLIEVLNRIHHDAMEKTIAEHPALYPVLTFDVLIDWLKSSEAYNSERVTIILTQKELLEKLNHDQIVILAKRLISDDFAKILAHRVFKAKLVKDPARNQLLMRLGGRISDAQLDIQIAKNPEIASLLTSDEIMLLVKSSPSIHKHIIKHDHVLDKLTSRQIRKIVKNKTAAAYYMASQRLDRLNNQDLILFFAYHLTPTALKRAPERNSILEKLPIEIDKRSDTLSGSEWLKLSCINPEIGLFVAEKYIKQFSNHQLYQLRDYYSNNSKIFQLISEAFKWRRTSIIISDSVHVEHQLANRTTVATREEASLKSTPEYEWFKTLAWGLLLLCGLISIALILTGLGSATGFILAVNITHFLFSSLSLSASLVSCLLGFAALIVVTGCWLATIDENDSEIEIHSEKVDHPEKEFNKSNEPPHKIDLTITSRHSFASQDATEPVSSAKASTSGVDEEYGTQAKNLAFK